MRICDNCNGTFDEKYQVCPFCGRIFTDDMIEQKTVLIREDQVRMQASGSFVAGRNAFPTQQPVHANSVEENSEQKTVMIGDGQPGLQPNGTFFGYPNAFFPQGSQPNASQCNEPQVSLQSCADLGNQFAPLNNSYQQGGFLQEPSAQRIFVSPPCPDGSDIPQNSSNMPVAHPDQKKKNGLVIGLACGMAVLLLLAALVCGIVFFNKKNNVKLSELPGVHTQTVTICAEPFYKTGRQTRPNMRQDVPNSGFVSYQ